MCNIINQYKLEDSCTPKKSSGRPSVIGNETGKKMIEEIKMDCETTAADLARNTKINHNNVSVSTIKRFLNDNDIVARRMIRTNFISEKNI